MELLKLRAEKAPKCQDYRCASGSNRGQVYHTTTLEQRLLERTPNTMLFQSLLSALLVFILPVSAQFQFFEQMFNQGGHQQQQQPQNAGSDSAWYQQRYEDGMTGLSKRPHLTHNNI
jgi:hypothetical protein